MLHKFVFWWKRFLLGARHAWQNGSLFYVLAALLLLPVWFNPVTQQQSSVQDTLYVIDISESMNVRDVDYPKPHSARLELAKHAVRSSMSQLACGSRVSVGLFAGDETVVLFEPLEICQHFPAIEQVVARLDSRMRWIGDSWIIRAMLGGIKEAQKRKLNLVFISDFDEMPHRSAPRLTDLLEVKGKVKGVLLGVGGEAPQPVPRLNGVGEIISYWTPEEAVLEGNHPNLLSYVKELKPGEKAPDGVLDEVGEHLSAFNRSMMQSTAAAATMDFLHIKRPQEALPILQNVSYQKEALAERDARWLYTLPAIFLILIGWFWQKLSRIFTRNFYFRF
ncbi:MAG TPA: vWA domain-containing protein [Methylotenera sp.]|nr:vWA domain-containing protein [Methylotenera sp.]HPH06542.1 vWA domain-containing protein [Methylotenera sp.]HPN01800.1 vWA domain-containing protein [Methylotenera sp.]